MCKSGTMSNYQRGNNCIIVTVSLTSRLKTTTFTFTLYIFRCLDVLAAEYPYTARSVLAFQKIDGQDICFFMMTVQEYGSDSPSINTGKAYISYLDSVQYFQPTTMKGAVYQEIIIGYLEQVKSMG